MPSDPPAVRMRGIVKRFGETVALDGVDFELHCKPIRGDWNGSGMHTNFSTKYLREQGGKPYFEKLMAAMDKYKDEHIAAYGPDNHLRLTGLHETQSIDKFNYGVANRGASVRIPHSFVANDAYRGYLEDRRPNSQADPYKVVSRLLKTIRSVGKLFFAILKVCSHSICETSAQTFGASRRHLISFTKAPQTRNRVRVAWPASAATFFKSTQGTLTSGGWPRSSCMRTCTQTGTLASRASPASSSTRESSGSYWW